MLLRTRGPRICDRSPTDAGFSAVELLVVVTIVALASAITVPMMGNLLSLQRIAGDAKDLSNSTAMTKMRAAARFAAARFYVDLSTRVYRAEVWNAATSTWTTEGPQTSLSSGVSLGFAGLTAAPPNTQGTIGQASPCLDNYPAGTAIANSACVVFNSRGLPVDSTGTPTGAGAFYIRDATSVYAVTVSATGMVRSWRTQIQATPNWVQQ